MTNTTTKAVVAAISILMISGAFALRKTNMASPAKVHSGAGMEDDAEQRLQWELKRLAAPDGKIPDNIRAKELAFAATLPVNETTPLTRSAFAGWSNRGPWNVGGRTRAFGVDQNNENNLLAGTTSGGMWRSSDGGNSWTMVIPSVNYHGVTCLVQDQRSGHDSVWYSGSGEGYGASASGGGAYYLGHGMMKSVDDGQTWNPITATTAGVASTFTSNWQIIWNIALDKHNTTSDVVYAALYGSIMKSTNGGTSWTTLKGGASYFTDVAVNDSGVVYITMDTVGAVGVRGIWRSPDGVTLTNILPVNFPKGYTRIVMGFNKQNQNEVYFLANTPHYGKMTVNFEGTPEWNSLWKYTYVSGDGSGTGGVWQDLSANLPGTGTYFDTWNVQGSYDMIVRVKPDDSTSVYIGGTNLYRSSSAFADSIHTQKIGGYTIGAVLPVVNSYQNHHPDQHVVAFSPTNPQIMFSCNDGGVFKTSNDTAASMVWTPLNNGYISSMFYTVAMDHASPGNNILVGGAQDNGSWYTNNTTLSSAWTHPDGGDGSYCAIADNQTAYYLSIQNGKTIKALLNSSGVVTSFRRIDPIGAKGYQFVNPFVIDPNNNNLMYMAGGKYMWRNNDLSTIPLNNMWDSISTNWVQFPDSVPTTNATITAVAISKTPANRLYYGTSAQKVYRLDNANTGIPTPPVNVTYSGFPASGYVSCIALDPNNADHVMVVFSNYGVYSIFYSSNGGTSWIKAAGNLEANISGTGNGPSIRWGSIMPVSNGYVYLVGTSVGVYATDTLIGTTTSSGTVWVQQAASTIGNTVCDMIDYRTSDGMVAVATHAGGIYTANITSTSNVASVHDLTLSSFGLTCYPNPFRDQCTVVFNMTEAANVRLQLYDQQGKLCRSVEQGKLMAGEHSINLSRNQLPNGIYYLGLQIGNATETRKLIIVQ